VIAEWGECVGYLPRGDEKVHLQREGKTNWGEKRVRVEG